MGLICIELILIALIAFSGAVVQGAIGFGLAIVAAPFLILIHPELVPGPVMFFGLVSACINLWGNLSGVNLRELTLALIARVPGTLIAMVVLLVATASMLSILLGLTVLLAVLLSVRTPKIKRTPKVMALAGFVSGFMGTTTAIGGPPMALAYQSASGVSVRANLGAYMIIGMIMSLTALVFVGRFNWDHLLVSLIMIVPVFLGALLARWIMRKIKPTSLRPAILVLCICSGLLALGNGLYESLNNVLLVALH